MSKYNCIIRQLNQGRERTLDPQVLPTNLKGWTIEKRRRLENNGNGKVDTVSYIHIGYDDQLFYFILLIIKVTKNIKSV